MKNEKHTGLKQYLSITEAAAFLGVSRPTIYSKLRSGELTYIQVSTRTVRIPIEALTSIQATSCASVDRRKLTKEDIKDYITRISQDTTRNGFEYMTTSRNTAEVNAGWLTSLWTSATDSETTFSMPTSSCTQDANSAGTLLPGIGAPSVDS